MSNKYLDKIAKKYGWVEPTNAIPKEHAVSGVPYNFNLTTVPRQTWSSRNLATTKRTIEGFTSPDLVRQHYNLPRAVWDVYNPHLYKLVDKKRNGQIVYDDKTGKPEKVPYANQMPPTGTVNIPVMPKGWNRNAKFTRLPDGVIWAQGRRESDGGIRNDNKASRGMFQPELPIFNRLVKRFPDQMKGITWEGLSSNSAHAHKVRDLTDLLNARDFNNKYGRLPTIKETLMMYKEGLNVFNRPTNSETYQRGREYVNNIVKDLFYHNPAYAKKVFPELVDYKDIPVVSPKTMPKNSSPVNGKTMPKNPSNVYTVKAGDSLSKIVANRGVKGTANIYNMVNKIKKINNMRNDVIRPNQQLKLPVDL